MLSTIISCFESKLITMMKRPATAEAIRMALDAGIPVDRITLSSDSNGSMPIFDARGNVLKLGVGDIRCLFEDWQLLVKAGLLMEDSLKIVTCNPAKRCRPLRQQGQIRNRQRCRPVDAEPESGHWPGAA